MRYMQANGIIAVDLERGEPIRATIEKLAADLGIVGAKIEAVGAVKDAELGYYVLKERRYLRKTFRGIVELLSLQGNLALRDGKPFMHAHVSLGRKNFSVFGGHLFDAKVGVALEMFITPMTRPIVRKDRDDVGLACWHLER